MELREYDAVQQGILTCMVVADHRRRLAAFLDGLRSDPSWNENQVRVVERKILNAIGDVQGTSYRVRPQFRQGG